MLLEVSLALLVRRSSFKQTEGRWFNRRLSGVQTPLKTKRW